MLNDYRPDFMRRHGVVLLSQTDQEVLVGRWKPLSEDLRRRLEAFHGKPVVTTVIDSGAEVVRMAMERGTAAAEGGVSDAVHGDGRSESVQDAAYRTRNLPPGEQLLRRLLRFAVDRRASDLSLWPVNAYQWRCTLRCGGVVQDLPLLDDHAARTVIRIIKINAGLDLMQRVEPQDGRLELPWLPDVTVRVATVGDPRNEALALRFLNRIPAPLGALGFSSGQLASILSALASPAGMVVCCGPTGAGKTTTVAAMAQILARTGRKVVSVEDPVEYRVPGVLQLEHSDAGRGCLAAALRQDPDVLWIGEVRRRDHVPPLAEAILSGHLVLSTVHAENAAGMRRRLTHLGVSREILDHHLVLVCAQRLEGDPVRLVVELSNQRQGDSDGTALA
jgi:general secretion pathway protein E